MKLLAYTGFDVSVGISHQKSNLTAMLKEAVLAERSLLVPQFHLAGRHNRGRALVSRMAEYFDYANVRVEGKAVGIVESAPTEFCKANTTVRREETLVGRGEKMLTKELNGAGLIRKVLEPVYPGFDKIPVQIPTHPALVRFAESLANNIPADAAWVHVRRGDILDRTASDTTPENIRRVLEKVSPQTRTVYIATDERDAGFFEPLARHYRLLRMKDFDPLKSLGAEDNYKLFLVEQEFGRRFPVRISTFKAPGNRFHGSLCDRPGWQ